MALPKSVTKTYKQQGQVLYEFTSNVDRVNFTLEQLIRRANMDVGKYIVKVIQTKVQGINNFTKRARYVPKRYQYWARKKENDLIIGVENTKKGADTAWWADQSELGTDGQPKRGFMRESVNESIYVIRRIQAQYLSAIENELEAERIAKQMDEMDDVVSDE